MTIANENLLREKENAIKEKLSIGEKHFLETFDFLHKHYALKNLSGKAPVLPVFEAIYIQNIDLPAWKLANHCHLSRTTLFNYRNIIVKDFYICLTENLISSESAATIYKPPTPK